MIVWDAIKEMREKSKRNDTFSFTFMSCNMTKGESDGVIRVMHGRFLSRESQKHHKDAELVERYIDLDTMEIRHFYQPLLMTYNGEKVTL